MANEAFVTDGPRAQTTEPEGFLTFRRAGRPSGRGDCAGVGLMRERVVVEAKTVSAL